MASKRKGKSAASESGTKRQRRSTETIPIPSIDPTVATVTQDASIVKLPTEILTQILSYILATTQGGITLHSASGRRWRNEVHALVDVDWNLSISVLPKDLRQDLRLEKKSTKSPLLDILLVCRSFYFAGIAAFFGENVVRFETVSHLDRLTAALDLDRRRCIRHVLFRSHFNSGILWSSDLVAQGERLGICFEKLPSLQTARIVYQTSNQLDQRMLEWHAGKLGEKFERVEDFCACKSQLLSLEVRDCDGREVSPRKVVSQPGLEALASEARSYWRQ